MASNVVSKCYRVAVSLSVAIMKSVSQILFADILGCTSRPTVLHSNDIIMLIVAVTWFKIKLYN